MEDNSLNSEGGCLTVTIPAAGKLIGLSRGASYEAAKRGDMPGVLRIGRRLMVSKAALQRALDNGWLPPKVA